MIAFKKNYRYLWKSFTMMIMFLKISFFQDDRVIQIASLHFRFRFFFFFIFFTLSPSLSFIWFCDVFLLCSGVCCVCVWGSNRTNAFPTGIDLTFVSLLTFFHPHSFFPRSLSLGPFFTKWQCRFKSPQFSV